MGHWDDYFKHEDPAQGFPSAILPIPLEKGHNGIRQDWGYVVEFQGGAVKPIRLSACSVPIKMNADLLRKASSSLTRQRFKFVFLL